MEYSESAHRPLHVYADHTWYFITSATVRRAHLLSTTVHLNIWLTELLSIVADLKIELAAWAVLENHYHLLLEFQRGRDLTKLMKSLHGRTSYQFNRMDHARGRQVWYSYWDNCIRSDDDFWTRFNYIHYNPVRHGYVQCPEDWEFSSYRSYLQEGGQEWLAECLQGHPEVNLRPEDDF
ncbi:MAG TPA: transposase [Anaerolineales bacterium]|jgi:putative transposase